MIISAEDKKLQSTQLTRLFNWFIQREDALQSKESVKDQKLKEEKL
jgi:hypothetical protein